MRLAARMAPEGGRAAAPASTGQFLTDSSSVSWGPSHASCPLCGRPRGEPGALPCLPSSPQDVLEAKNSTIQDLQYELARVCKVPSPTFPQGLPHPGPPAFTSRACQGHSACVWAGAHPLRSSCCPGFLDRACPGHVWCLVQQARSPSPSDPRSGTTMPAWPLGLLGDLLCSPRLTSVSSKQRQLRLRPFLTPL